MPMKYFFIGMMWFTLLNLGCQAMQKNRDFELTELSLADADFHVDITRYGASTPSDKALIILPPTGGVNLIDRSYARQFAKVGYDVFLLNSWTKPSEQPIDLELHQRFYSRAQQALSIALKQIPSHFIGLLGTSVGALHASVAASTQPRIDAVFVIVGGTPISEVIVTSDQKAMQDLKAKRKIKYGFKNDEENIIAIDHAFQLEPTRLAQIFKNKDLGMVMALDDSTVPTKTQNQLRNLWQPKVVINHSSSHFWGIIKAWWFNAEEIQNFFEQSFANKRPINREK